MFDTLKTKCARHFYNDVFARGRYETAALESLRIMKETMKLNNFREVLDSVRNKGYDAIMRTDIRNVKALAESFPAIVPSWVKAGNYSPELTDNGWELIKLN
jgi:hypothetical protein